MFFTADGKVFFGKVLDLQALENDVCKLVKYNVYTCFINDLLILFVK